MTIPGINLSLHLPWPHQMLKLHQLTSKIVIKLGCMIILPLVLFTLLKNICQGVPLSSKYMMKCVWSSIENKARFKLYGSTEMNWNLYRLITHILHRFESVWRLSRTKQVLKVICIHKKNNWTKKSRKWHMKLISFRNILNLSTNKLTLI